MKKFFNVAYWVILFFYVLLLIDTVFFARDARRSINLVPFQMISEQGFSLNVWGNIVLFIPAGIYIALQLKSFRFLKALIYLIGASLAIEIGQFIFSRGATDIDDVLLNTTGGLIGLFIYILFSLVFKTKEKIMRALTVLSLIAGIPTILLLIFLLLAN